VIPQEQHIAVRKEMGETAHVERWKNTLRQSYAQDGDERCLIWSDFP
jgi:insertion element IS1 protein InsB